MPRGAFLWMAVLVTALWVTGCPKSTPSKTTDAGQDAGVSPFACDVGEQDCADAGVACMYVQGGSASACRAGACDIVTQIGCADDEKCGYAEDAGYTARACVPNGTADAGEPCSVDGVSCLRGLGCVGSAGSGADGVCERFCYNDDDCASSEECGDEFLVYEGTDEAPSFCSPIQPTCDLLNQASCTSAGSGQGCYSGTHHPVCLPEGSGESGSSCLVSNDCSKGWQCMGNPPNAICRQLCRLPGGTPQCPSGTTCSQVNIPGGAGVGVCL